MAHANCFNQRMRGTANTMTLRRISYLAALLSITIGAVAIVGWVRDIPTFRSVFPGFVAMKFNTALGLICSGMAMLTLCLGDSYGEAARRWLHASAGILGCALILNGACVLLEYGAGLDLQIDQLFWRQSIADPTTYFPGRMSPSTAFDFVFVGTAFLALWRRQQQWLAQTLAIIVLVSSFAAITGYCYGATVLYAAGHLTAVAFHTAVAFFFLSIGILCLQPERGLVKMLASPGLDGHMARRYVPAAIAMPFLVGWVRLWGQNQGYYDTETGLALYCLSNIGLFFTLILWNTRHLSRVEAALHESTDALSESEQRFRSMADAIPQLAWMARADGAIFWYNKRWYEYTGTAPIDMEGWGWQSVHDPAFLPQVLERWKLSVETGEPFDMEFPLRGADQTFRPFLTRVMPLKDAEGKVMQWFGTNTDITDQKRARVELEKGIADRTAELAGAKARLQAVLDAATRVSVIATDTGGTITLFNAGSETMLGYTAAEMVGKQTPAIIHVEAEVMARGAELSELLGRKIEGFDVFVELPRLGRPEEREWTYLRKDGSEITVTLAVTATHDAKGEVDGFLGVAMDTTERKRVEVDLRLAKEAAETANHTKSEFLANMSHEIRTPMNGIIGMTELTLDTELTPTQRDYLQMAKHSAESLLSLINDILDFSKMEAGKLSLESVSFDLRETVEKTLKTLSVRSERKGLHLLGTIDKTLPPSLKGDPMRIAQILINLVDNAIKFTDMGAINVALNVSQKTGDRWKLDFSVRDTGIGIPPEKQEAIFSAFAQADGSTTRNHGGTGLGLTICSMLVEQMGGRLSVESAAGRGSTFRFTISLDQTTDAASSSDSKLQGRTAAEMKGRPLRVLIAEDNMINQAVAIGMLEKNGHLITCANDGRQAVEAFQRERFDIVLMDVQMPILDGFGATAEIRELERADKRHIPIIAMTAHAMAGDRERCLAAGMDDYVAKPISEKAMLDVTQKFGDGLVATPVESIERSSQNDLLIRFAGNTQLLQRLSKIFAEDAPVTLGTLEGAIAARDGLVLKRTAHKLLGSLVSLGAGEAVTYAREIEGLGENNSFAEASELFVKLRDEMDTVQSRLAVFD